MVVLIVAVALFTLFIALAIKQILKARQSLRLASQRFDIASMVEHSSNVGLYLLAVLGFGLLDVVCIGLLLSRV